MQTAERAGGGVGGQPTRSMRRVFGPSSERMRAHSAANSGSPSVMQAQTEIGRMPSAESNVTSGPYANARSHSS